MIYRVYIFKQHNTTQHNTTQQLAPLTADRLILRYWRRLPVTFSLPRRTQNNAGEDQRKLSWTHFVSARPYRSHGWPASGPLAGRPAIRSGGRGLSDRCVGGSQTFFAAMARRCCRASFFRVALRRDSSVMMLEHKLCVNCCPVVR